MRGHAVGVGVVVVTVVVVVVAAGVSRRQIALRVR